MDRQWGRFWCRHSAAWRRLSRRFVCAPFARAVVLPVGWCESVPLIDLWLCCLRLMPFALSPVRRAPLGRDSGAQAQGGRWLRKRPREACAPRQRNQRTVRFASCPARAAVHARNVRPHQVRILNVFVCTCCVHGATACYRVLLLLLLVVVVVVVVIRVVVMLMIVMIHPPTHTPTKSLAVPMPSHATPHVSAAGTPRCLPPN